MSNATRLALAMLTIALLVTACVGGGGGKDPLPIPSPRGTPTGQPVHATIGPAGGVIASADGTFTITLPAGALRSETALSLQPLTNTAPHGRGAGYRLMPADLRLEVPLRVEVRDLPSGHTVAWQGADGVWRALPPTGDRGSLAAEVGGGGALARAAGDFAAFEAFRLVPTEGVMRPSEQRTLTVEACVRANLDHIADLLPTCEPLTLAPLIKNAAVNGVAGGSAETGTVYHQPGRPTLVYTAPAQAPASNPVAVSVEISLLGPGLNLLVSELHIGNPARAYDLVEFDGRGLPSEWLPHEPWTNAERVTGGRLTLGEGGTYSLRLEWVEDRGNGETLAQFMQDAGNYRIGPANRIVFDSLVGDTFTGASTERGVSVHGFALHTSNTSVIADLAFR